MIVKEVVATVAGAAHVLVALEAPVLLLVRLSILTLALRFLAHVAHELVARDACLALFALVLGALVGRCATLTHALILGAVLTVEVEVLVAGLLALAGVVLGAVGATSIRSMRANANVELAAPVLRLVVAIVALFAAFVSWGLASDVRCTILAMALIGHAFPILQRVTLVTFGAYDVVLLGAEFSLCTMRASAFRRLAYEKTWRQHALVTRHDVSSQIRFQPHGVSVPALHPACIAGMDAVAVRARVQLLRVPALQRLI
jgi:hypothetical protein